MRFSDYFKEDRKKPVISFEIFPPKTDKGMENLVQVLNELSTLSPDYITVTYGAMGTTRDRTLEITSMIKNEFQIESACHLTCVGSSREELDHLLGRIYDAGIRNIVAIRGDPPGGESSFIPPDNGYSYASELVEHIRKFEKQNREIKEQFGIAVGGYPEKHLEAVDIISDISYLKHKVESGADVIITQLFFDNSHYFDFVNRVRTEGISVPIIPGLMPILSANQIERITSMCGTTIPDNLKYELNNAKNDNEKACEIGITQCINQAKELIKSGVPGIHFYVLNKSHHMKSIIEALNPQRHELTENQIDAGNQERHTSN